MRNHTLHAAAHSGTDTAGGTRRTHSLFYFLLFVLLAAASALQAPDAHGAAPSNLHGDAIPTWQVQH
ncbi:hypothetical protein N8I74_18915 [Chitiniphilus purpureus]|uniref:Uncharacterized protein n=1 Tax=Chitiniphilus purpureus TaxID=2981137 RepID=A0ABY6DLV0_9NEIS|nr:hypothetical protein [Chitiniphilus sp. CD1]UXY15354.1 hypothetical protein N8I74_18915 [Chitiniphilus sp. CD1]